MMQVSISLGYGLLPKMPQDQAIITWSNDSTKIYESIWWHIGASFTDTD